MRGVETKKTVLRRRIFEEVARFAYEDGKPKEFNELPYKIIPGEIATYRESIFLERAIVGERLRAAMGMSTRPLTQHSQISDGLKEAMKGELYYEPPLVSVIRFACHACPDKRVFVTDGCQGCLEHPCQDVCPKGAISMENGRSHIDESKCVRCGLCMNACQYNAIIRQERPCVKACGVGAITTDRYNRAKINQDKCVQCGMCLVSCPFAAIVDKGQIYQTIKAIKGKHDVYAILAPAYVGQFGGKLTPTRVRSAFQALGFKDVAEVAVGADLCTIEEANDFLKEVPGKLPFLCTSCCPAWSVMVRKNFPDAAKSVSMALTPMVLTARLLKTQHPDCKICFVGPCLSKKQEASRKSIKSYVDFCLTFEEVAGMFDAREVDLDKLPDSKPLREASGDGRGFAASGGVANAVVNYVRKIDPTRDVKVQKGDGLAECKTMMNIATKTHKYDGYLLEGMACPGGCIAGAGTLQPEAKSKVSLTQSIKDADFQQAAETTYADWITDLEHIDEMFAEANEHPDD